MPNGIRIIPVTADQLADAGVIVRADAGPHRILIRYEIDEITNRNAIGLYVEAMVGGRWMCVSDGVSDDENQAIESLRRLETLAHSLDAGLNAWVGEFDAREE